MSELQQSPTWGMPVGPSHPGELFSWGPQAGHEVILQCESDPGAQQVLSENFPGVLLVPDVRFLAALPRVQTPLCPFAPGCVVVRSDTGMQALLCCLRLTRA